MFTGQTAAAAGTNHPQHTSGNSAELTPGAAALSLLYPPFFLCCLRSPSCVSSLSSFPLLYSWIQDTTIYILMSIIKAHSETLLLTMLVKVGLSQQSEPLVICLISLSLWPTVLAVHIRFKFHSRNGKCTSSVQNDVQHVCHYISM